MLRNILELPCALFCLLRLAIRTRFRFRGEYWSWRLNTAYGRGMPSSRWALILSTIDYGRWMHRTLRMR
ncbi:MAG: hypothetical protein ACK4WH_02055 [Phycisphaerales bacterium]